MPYARMLRLTGLGLLLCCAATCWAGESLTVVPGRIPYMEESVGHVVVTTVPDDSGQNLTLEVSIPGGKMIGTGPVVPAQRSVVEFLLGGFAEGETTLHCRLLAAGKEVATSEAAVTKLPPKSNAVQIDNRRRGLIVDGLPFFPFGFVCIPDGRGQGDPSIPPDFAEHGFNLYSPYSSGKGSAGLEHIRTWMDKCAETGVKVLFDLRFDCFEPFWKSREAEWTPEGWQALRTLVEGIRDHPALMAWYIADEPRDRHLETLAEMRQFIKKLDPYHPTCIVFQEEPALPKRREWRHVTDVTWTDCYPVSSFSTDQKDNPYWIHAPVEHRRGVASITAYWIGRLDEVLGHSSPLWYNPQFMGGGCHLWDSYRREPSAQEVRSMTYAGLVSGVTGIFNWPYTPRFFPTSPRLMDEAGKLSQEVMEMTPFLLSEEPRRTAAASGADVLASAWQDRGMAMLMAVNVENAPAVYQVTLEDSNYSGPAEVLFENREVEVRSGVIEDTIEALGTRVYQIPEGPFPVDRATLDPGNIRFNPSFEEWVSAASPPDITVKRSPGSTCWMDGRTAVHGRHSLRMTAADSEGIHLWLSRVGQYSVFKGTKIQSASRYRVSFWAKADRPGLSLLVKVPNTDQPDGEQFALGTEWKEYSTVVTTPDAPADAEIVFHPELNFEGPGAAWLDLLQVVPCE